MTASGALSLTTGSARPDAARLVSVCMMDVGHGAADAADGAALSSATASFTRALALSSAEPASEVPATEPPLRFEVPPTEVPDGPLPGAGTAAAPVSPATSSSAPAVVSGRTGRIGNGE